MKREYETGLLQMRILWAITKGKRYGYEILKFLNSSGSRVEHPNLYSALKKLEKMGLVKSEKHGRKVMYHATESGKDEFKRVVLEFLDMYRGIFEDYMCKTCSKRVGK